MEAVKILNIIQFYYKFTLLASSSPVMLGFRLYEWITFFSLGSFSDMVCITSSQSNLCIPVGFLVGLLPSPASASGAL